MTPNWLEYVGLQAGQIVLAGMGFLGAADVAKRGHDAIDDLFDALGLVVAFEQCAPHAVHGLALLVHHVVVFEQVFAGGEVLRFHGFLRGGDALGDEARLDGYVFFHAEPQHQVLHALAAEDPHQIVLQRQVEARTAGVALAAGASAKLIVDAARFVAFGAEHVQAAGSDHFIVFDWRFRP